MHVTIAICTWNRAAMLDRLLAELRLLSIPAGVLWEVLVVNNASTDATDDVLHKHTHWLPLRSVHEPTPGIAHARNRALTEARGAITLWTDDDMAVPADWVACYLAAAERYPAAVLFGGPIKAWFAHDVTLAEREFTDRHIGLLSPMFGLIDLGREVRPLAAGELFFSGNMALRTEAARRFHFDGRFGRVGKHGLLGGEETLFLQQMLNGGAEGVWVGTAWAKHWTPRERLTRDYAWRYFAALGRTQVRREGLPACPTFLGRPRWVLLQSARHRLLAGLKRPLGLDWLPHYLTSAKLDGYLAECRDHRHANSAKSGFLVPPHQPTTVSAS
jgi:glycosyltransferase involved in cell wall biosynthesis